MINLISGANSPVSGEHVEVVISWPTTSGSLDPSAFLIAQSGKVRGDADMVFYNQPSAQADCVRLMESVSGQARFSVALSAVPTDVARIVFCLTVETEKRSMSAFDGTSLRVLEHGIESHRFDPSLAGATEVSFMMAELYRRQGSWKIRAIGQGFRNGLGALATSLGVDVEGEPDAAPSPAAVPPPPPASATTPPPPPPPPLQPTSPGLPPPAAAPPRARTQGSKLFEKGETLLGAGHGGRVTVALDWRWTIGGNDGRIRPVTLALGAACIAADGSRSAVQSPDWRGRLEAAPWLTVDSANLANGNTGQERLSINLEGFADYSQIDIYAYIADGASTWCGMESWVSVSGPSMTTSEFCVNPPADGMAAIALLRIENRISECAVTRLDGAGATQHELDQQLGWNLSWQYPKKP